MGVPITFLDKYNSEQFELLGISHPNDNFTGIRRTKRYIGYQKFNKDSVLLSKNGTDCNNRCCLKGKLKDKNYYQLGDDIIHVTYARLFIKHKQL